MVENLARYMTPSFVYTVSKKRGEVERGRKEDSSGSHSCPLFFFFFKALRLSAAFLLCLRPDCVTMNNADPPYYAFSRKTVTKEKYSAEFLGFLALMRDRYQA